MPFNQVDGVRYYTFKSLVGKELVHAVFTRQGGVSPSPWAELNVGGTVGDDPQRVAQNRQRTFDSLGLDIDTLFDVWQIHGREVVKATAPRSVHQLHDKADAMISDQPGVSLFMRFADCVPILLFDPYHKAVGIAHAGWQGTVKYTAAAAVEAMQQAYGSVPSEIHAAIGPSIGAHHYAVGNEVVSQVEQAFGDDASGLLLASLKEVQFDLWAANRLVLERSGVQQIEVAGICTACNQHDWFSHRGEHGRTGRFGALITLAG